MKKKRSGAISIIFILFALFAFIIYGIFFTNWRDRREGEEVVETTSTPSPTPKEEEEVKPIVVLDAAFGGELSGYEGIIKEAELNAMVVDAIKARLEKDDRFEVVLTHESNTSAPVKEKAAKINELKPALFITICSANSGNKDTSGMHIYIDKPNMETFDNSLKLATLVQSEFTTEEKPVDIRFMYYEPIGNNRFQIRYVATDDYLTGEKRDDPKRDTWLILESTDAVGIVVEQMYVTSQSDLDKWTTKEGLATIAEAYYKVVCAYLNLE